MNSVNIKDVDLNNSFFILQLEKNYDKLDKRAKSTNWWYFKDENRKK